MKANSIERSQLGPAPGSSESDEHGRAVIQDFTLVIPTYDRPKPLKALLTYLGQAAAMYCPHAPISQILRQYGRTLRAEIFKLVAQIVLPEALPFCERKMPVKWG
jgi:hypothetical protein